MKTAKSVLSSFLLLTVAGLLITLVNKSVLETKRNALYGYQSESVETTNKTNITIPVTESTSEISGPMSNVITKEMYLSEMAVLEQQIADVWANITDTGGSSAIQAANYEKSAWDNELAEIMQMFYQIQSAENVEAIKQEEIAFQADRDKKAQNAAKAAGEAPGGLSYYKEYARLTKEKTYEYIYRYFAEE